MIRCCIRPLGASPSAAGGGAGAFIWRIRRRISRSWRSVGSKATVAVFASNCWSIRLAKALTQSLDLGVTAARALCRIRAHRGVPETGPLGGFRSSAACGSHREERHKHGTNGELHCRFTTRTSTES